MNETYKQLFWAIVELFGHNVIAGELGEETLGPEVFLRVDVPGIGGNTPFTKYYGKGAVYSITPTDEDTARAAIVGLAPKPIEVWKLNIEEKATQLEYPLSYPHELPESNDDDYDDIDVPF